MPVELRTFLHNHSQQGFTSPKPAAQPADGRPADAESIVGRALTMASRDGRNNAGFWMACQLRDNDYSLRDAEAAMRDYRERVPPTNTKGKRRYTEHEMKASLGKAFQAREPWERRSFRPGSRLPEDRVRLARGCQRWRSAAQRIIRISRPGQWYARVTCDVYGDPSGTPRHASFASSLFCSCWAMSRP